jgi:predicted PurR-regulated permease PerM
MRRRSLVGLRRVAEVVESARSSRILRAMMIVLALWITRSFLVPVALGGVAAIVLAPVQRAVQARLPPRIARRVPIALTVLFLFLVLVPLTFLGVGVLQRLARFAQHDLVPTLQSLLSFGRDRLGFALERLGAATDLEQRFSEAVPSVAASLASWLGAAARQIPSRFIDVFLFACALFYFLREGDRFARVLASLLPLPARETRALYAAITDTVRGALLAMIAAALVQGVMTTAALAIFRVPGAPLLGTIATFLALLPMIGTTPVTLGSAIYLLATSRFGAAAGMLVAALVIGTVDNFIRPWVQASRSPLPPMFVLLGIFGGIRTMGPSGIFLGPVIVAVALVAVTTLRNRADQAASSAAARRRLRPRALTRTRCR